MMKVDAQEQAQQKSAPFPDSTEAHEDQQDRAKGIAESKAKPKATIEAAAPGKPSNKKKSDRSNRDNFSATTVRLLRDMAGNVCSKPDCHVHTHGSKAGRDGAFSIGVACHIKAAAPGGPRYDPDQTGAQRKHPDNGIWMCQTHSRLVDVDGVPYPVEVLNEWKKLAELRANEMVNRRAFTETEVSEAVDRGAVRILDKFINRTENPIDSPIAQMLEGYEAGLEGLDPRFRVDVSTVAGNVHHFISPVVSGTKIKLLVKNISNLAGFSEAERGLFEEGRELVIPGPNFEFAGSKLFEAMHPKGGDREGVTLTLGGLRKPLKANLYARDLQGHEQLIESFTTHYVSGAARTVVEGTCLDGLLSVRTVIDHGGKNKFDLTFHMEAWQGKNILDLPQGGRLIKALDYLREGHLVVELEVADDHARFSTTGDEAADDFTAQFYWIILFLSKARQIAAKCTAAVILRDVDLSREVFKTLTRYCRLLAGPVPGKRTPSKLGEGKFSFSEGRNVESLLEKADSGHFTVTPQEPEDFRLFGQTIRPPRVRTSYTHLDFFFYSELPSRDTWLELHTHDKTLIEFTLEDEPWRVMN